jgi:hypothetical protein
MHATNPAKSGAGQAPIDQDWRELHFSRPRVGIGVRDSLQAEVAYDCELVRCSRAIVDYVLEFPDRIERGLAHLRSLPHLARWAPNLKAGLALKDFENLEFLKTFPIIPTVVLICPWFPSPWLYGSAKDRHKILTQLEKAYAHQRPLQLKPYPVDPEYLRLLEQCASKKFRLWVVGIDEEEPFATTAARLIEARKELGHDPTKRGKHHRIDRGAVAALHRLTCYRLSLMPPKQRAHWIEKIPEFLRSKNVDTKIAQGAAQVKLDFSKRHYLKLL